MRNRLLRLAAAIFSISAGVAATAAPCLPAGLAAAIAPARQPVALPIHMYLDRSQSMSGYVAQPGHPVRVYGDLLQLTADRGEQQKIGVDYRAFGKNIVKIDAAAASQFATFAPYNCKNCDNQESRIDTVLRAVALQPTASLSVIVTDLWLDNTSFKGGPAVALGGPLKQMIAAGRTVAILGIRAPFAGHVYDIPGAPTYELKGERPLFVLVVGPDVEVAAFTAMLRASGSSAFDDVHLRQAAFGGAGPARLVAAPAIKGGGIIALPPLAGLSMPHWRIDTGLARNKNGSIERTYTASDGVSPGVIWSGPPDAKTTVWAWSPGSCRPGSWQPAAPLVKAWWPRKDGGAVFRLDAASAEAMVPQHSYLVAGLLGTRGLYTPNPGAAWLREWSVTPEGAAGFVSGKPKWFKALDLAVLATLMEQGVAAALPKGRMSVGFAFAVTVE